jgi:hypothetical protein
MGRDVSIPDVETEEDEFTDPTEKIRIAIMVVGLAFNLWLMWDFVKDRPEFTVTRRRVQMWWEQTFTGPAAKVKAMRRAEGETVFEAMQIVGGDGAGS